MIGLVDVSGLSGSVNWQAQADKGARGAIVRAAMGTGKDLAAESHLRGALAHGMTCNGTYLYVRGDRTPAEQVAVYFAAHRDLEAKLGTQLAWNIDLEDRFAPGVPWHRPAYARIALDVRRSLRVQTQGVLGIYVSTWFAHELHLDATFADDLLWLADWTPPADVPEPWKAAGRSWTVWQQKGGAVDWNAFDGTEADWRFAYGLNAPNLSVCPAP